MAESAGPTDEEVLVVGVALFVRARDLREDPPGPDETLAQIGVGANSLDLAIRDWINDRFRAPPKRKLMSGDLEPSMTWAAFVLKALG
ncbi:MULTISPECIES: hypothetical protein [unclassified Caulobacter]|uniref:hypothetical protein n=1 Tax=unclassified Caulobacter TaxID=2648921 RepID=UPI0004A740F4|nr:hypothetical protein [Caulobacter sp. UNC358MFTsu5.1]